ncbi:hypothetical protein [Stygiolobus caldivivus]|uniref:Uncharacterized protein n=1 Tax=Stygiolobus caldivivus TaxID=2824673 RepID=A0A8D5U8E7_9CREN|nr:hypothetical protein [Stygiolobus caldivivus]BCU70925.1 hypothetical protein KN1_22220 [Stygiolobus caldivivus]
MSEEKERHQEDKVDKWDLILLLVEILLLFGIVASLVDILPVLAHT